MNVPMIYVNPVTGPYAGRKWLCYVCELGSAPVLAVFIGPDVIRDDMRAIRMVQQLVSRQGNALQAFVVVLSGPDPELEARLRTSAEAERLTVPLAVLPEQAAVRAIHKALPVRRGAAITALLYRGRRITRVFSDEHFFGAVARSAAAPAADEPLLEEWRRRAELAGDLKALGVPTSASVPDLDSSPGALARRRAHRVGFVAPAALPMEEFPGFREMDDAAAAMVQAWHRDV